MTKYLNIFNCNSINKKVYTIIKRFMVKKTSSMVLPTISSNKQLTHIVRSSYGLINQLFAQQNNQNSISKYPLVENSVKFIADSAYGNNLIKSNFLSALCPKTIPIKQIKDAFDSLYPDNIIDFAVETLNKSPINVSPSRFIPELLGIHNHSNIHKEFISKVLITGDTIHVPSKSNPYPDAFLNLQSNYGMRKVFCDFKSGNGMTKEPLKGTIGQVTYDEDTQIYVPNTEVDLLDFNKRRLDMIFRKKDDIKFNLNNQEKETFNFYMQECSLLLETKYQHTVNLHNQIEKFLYNIQSLPRLNKGISFINIVHIQTDKPIFEKELKFIQEVITFVDPTIFANPRLLNNFIKKCFNVYKKLNPDVIDNIKKLKGTDWSIKDDIFNIDITIFT